MKKHRLSIILTSLSLAAVLCLGAVELLVRAHDYLTAANSMESQEGEWLEPNKTWGVWHKPNARAIHKKQCFQATYSANTHGMRDKERNFSSSKFRIAMLGDSMLEGYSVSDEEVVTRVLEDEIYDGRFEFLNFGSAGNFGTIQQLLIYRGLARKFKPDLVIVFFLSANDLKDNSLEIQKHISYGNYWNRPFLSPGNDGNWTLTYHDFGNPPKRSGKPRYKCSSDSYCTLRYARLAAGQMLNWGALRPIYKVPSDPMYERSWAQTKVALNLLMSEVERDGGRLVLFDIPAAVQFIPRYMNKLSTTAGFDPFAPNKRLEKIAEEMGVTYIFPFNEFSNYIKENDLAWPYLTHACDSHWAALGHKVAARALAQNLDRLKLLPSAD